MSPSSPVIPCPFKSFCRWAKGNPAAGGDDLPSVYSGTLVVQGFGIAEVQATGMNTEIGKIGKALKTIEQEQTRIQVETRKLVRTLAILGVSLFAVVVIVYGITRNDWLNGLLAGITWRWPCSLRSFPLFLPFSLH